MASERDRQDEHAEADAPPMPAQAELESMFDADDAHVEAGRITPVKPVLAEMRATAARVRRERAAKKATMPQRV